MAKNLTLRLTDAQATAVEAIAKTDNKSVTVVIRDALDAAVETARNDIAFQARLKARHESEAVIYERLSK